ncbi:uncharacterized protein [Lepeophtheirus salmonis]
MEEVKYLQGPEKGGHCSGFSRDNRLDIIGIPTEPVVIMVENLEEPWKINSLVVRGLGVPFILSLKTMRQLSISLELGEDIIAGVGTSGTEIRLTEYLGSDEAMELVSTLMLIDCEEVAEVIITEKTVIPVEKTVIIEATAKGYKVTDDGTSNIVWFTATEEDWKINLESQLTEVRMTRRGDSRVKLVISTVEEEPRRIAPGRKIGTIRRLKRYTPTHENLLASMEMEKICPPSEELEKLDPNINYSLVLDKLFQYIGKPIKRVASEAEKIKNEINIMFGGRVRKNDYLSGNERALVEELLYRFYGILSKDSSNVGRTEILEFAVDTSENEPVKAKVRPMNPAVKESFKGQLQQWIEEGIIEPTISE